MAKRPAEKTDWFVRILDYYWIQNLLKFHPELTYWIIRWDGKKKLEWFDLNEVEPTIQPSHFEIYYGKESLRSAYYLNTLRAASKDRLFRVTEFMGFSDLFFPLPQDKTGQSFIFAGQFCSELLDWEGISKRWTELTGHAPASADPDFVRYVRMVLRLPVLSADVLRSIERFLALYAEFLDGSSSGTDLYARALKLKKEGFVRQWSNTAWVDRAVNSEKFRLTPWYHEGRLVEWMIDEMQIQRLPTTAIALMPLESKEQALDPVQLLVRNNQIQHECIHLATEMLETGATRIQDYGVLLLTSADPKKNAARSRLELRDRARFFQDFVKERFDVRTVVGIGSTLPPGEPLYSSYNEAVRALHLCVQLEQDTLFYDAKQAPKQEFRYATLHEAESTLSDAVDRMATDEVKVASDQYVRLVLVYAKERIEAVRGQFLATLFQLIQNIQKRHLLRKDTVEGFASDLSRRLEEAASVYQLIEAFKDALQRLSFYASRALEGPQSIRLSATLQYLQESFTEPLKLPMVARQAGFSVPAFSRVFRQATGTSFLAYLRGIRVEHAQKLLRTTPLSVEQIAQACGFQSPHHLIRSFKTVTGQTPTEYRRWVEAKHQPE